jgi:hypothetical protein
MSEMTIGNRTVSKGDTVRVAKGGVDATGFNARFVGFDADTGTVTVYGGRGFKPELRMTEQKGVAQFRFVSVDRVKARNQQAGGRPRFFNPHR